MSNPSSEAETDDEQLIHILESPNPHSQSPSDTKKRSFETAFVKDLEIIQEQQVVEIPDFENENESSPNEPEKSQRENKPVRDYKCPICFESPDPAVITSCGHVFCNSCLFHMVNSSRTATKKSGKCALCRSNVSLKDIRLIVLRKQLNRKKS